MSPQRGAAGILSLHLSSSLLLSEVELSSVRPECPSHQAIFTQRCTASSRVISSFCELGCIRHLFASNQFVRSVMGCTRAGKSTVRPAHSGSNIPGADPHTHTVHQPPPQAHRRHTTAAQSQSRRSGDGDFRDGTSRHHRAGRTAEPVLRASKGRPADRDCRYAWVAG